MTVDAKPNHRRRALWKTALLWVAVPIVFLLGTLLSAVLVSLIFEINRALLGGFWFPWVEWSFDRSETIARGLAAGFLGLYWAVRVAPMHRTIVAFILFTLTTLLAGFVLAVYAYGNPSSDAFAADIAEIVLAVVGAGSATYMFYLEEREDDQPS